MFKRLFLIAFAATCFSHTAHAATVDLRFDSRDLNKLISGHDELEIVENRKGSYEGILLSKNEKGAPNGADILTLISTGKPNFRDESLVFKDSKGDLIIGEFFRDFDRLELVSFYSPSPLLPTPLPAAALLFGCALAGLGFAAYRKRAASI